MGYRTFFYCHSFSGSIAGNSGVSKVLKTCCDQYKYGCRRQAYWEIRNNGLIWALVEQRL